MEAAPSAKPRREPPPIPPNYVSLKRLQELRLKEEEEKRRREEEAAAAKRAAALKAEEAAMDAAVKREAALKAETKGRAVSREAFCGVKERHRGGRAQGQGHQWVAVGYGAPATTPWPTPTCGEAAAREKEWIVEGNRGKKGPDDAADNAPHPHGGCKSPWKGKKKASSCHTVGDPGNLAKAAAPAASNGGKPEKKSEIKAMGKASAAPLDPGKAAVASSPGHLTCKGRKGAGGRSAETSPGDAPAKTAGPSPPRGVKSGNTGKPRPAAPRLADAATGRDSPEGKDAAPAQAPPTSAADGSSKPTVETKPEGLVEGQRRQPAQFGKRSAEPWRGRGNGAAEPHGRVWVPKAKAAAAGSSAGTGDK
ncbi:uncharacterized protein [Miscanthus floridulus]|uniref:uncharacterized protein n=1 Tax=Miscanthus floridulus TaxID=154761 RepID=UPI00345B44DC